MMAKDGKGGHIVNIGSLSAEYAERDADIYVATKSAIRGFTSSLRKKVNEKNIKVTLIEPGSVGTNMVDETSAEQNEKQKAFTMLKAEDIAETIFFCLALPERTEIMTVQIKPFRN